MSENGPESEVFPQGVRHSREQGTACADAAAVQKGVHFPHWLQGGTSHRLDFGRDALRGKEEGGGSSGTENHSQVQVRRGLAVLVSYA